MRAIGAKGVPNVDMAGAAEVAVGNGVGESRERSGSSVVSASR